MFPSLAELEQWASDGYTFLPVALELPADTLTPVAAYLALRATGARESFLLESAEGGDEVGRYSFLGLEPFARLTCQDGLLSITSDSETTTHETSDVFRAIAEYLGQFRAPDVTGLPPFQGGAIGYVGYDAVRYLEAIPLPDAPHPVRGPEADLMLFRQVVAFDRLKHRLYIMSHVRVGQGDLARQYELAKAEIGAIRERLERADRHATLLQVSLRDRPTLDRIDVTATMGREAYMAGVKKIKDHIRRGDIFQCVLSDRFTFPMKADPFTVYRVLRMINPSPYLFYLDLGDRTLLGSSPEMLVQKTGQTVATCPIAGTRPRGMTEADDKKLERDLLQSVKEKAEHLMLVDLGRNDIGRVSRPGSVEVKRFMHVERYSHVMHLVSVVEGRLRSQLDAWDGLAACFPAGTLSGAPKIRAMEIISAIEPERRGPYGGAVVYFDFSGNLNSCITIRSLLVKDGVGYAQAGAGIVADSRPDKEYEEVANKAKAVMMAVALAESHAAAEERLV